MRCPSSTNITSFEAIIDLIKSLNYDWYESKKKFFSLEPCYDKKSNKIIIKGVPQHWEYDDEETGEYKDGLYYPDMIEYSLSQYCWISKFEGCLAYDNIEIIDDFPLEIHDLPVDVKEVYEALLQYIDVTFEDITQLEYKVKIINEIINLVNVNLLFSNTNDHAFEEIIRTLKDNIIDGIKKRHNNISNLYYKFGEKPLGIESNINKKPLLILLDNNIGFEYINHYTNPDSIKDVFISLVKANLIDSTTKLTDFKKVFCNQKVSKSIVWSGTIADLAYFIKIAIQLKKLSKPIRGSHWDICNNCFQLQNDSKLVNDQLRYAKRPASYMHINTIVRNFI